MDKVKSIQVLQAYATGLQAQSFSHKVQSLLFASKGYGKLAEKYAGHAAEEAGYVEQFINRIIDLGGEAKVEAAPAQPIFSDPVQFIKADLAISREQVPILMQVVLSLADDITTYDILKAYAKDEEDDMYWMEQQLEMIDAIGLQNWLVKQI